MKPTTKIKTPWSMAIQDITYNEGTRELIIHMEEGSKGGGKKLLYTEVPKEVFEGFQQADSKGKYFNSHIREKYPYLGEV
jgi:hypothetical protein